MPYPLELNAMQAGHPAAAPAASPHAPKGGLLPPPPVELVHTSAVNSAPEVYQACVSAAVYKHNTALPKLVLQGVAAGLFIALGFTTCALVGGNLSPELRKAQPGLFAALYSVIGFPLGLILIVFCGGDLFTGNCFYSFSAVVEGRLPLWAGFRLLLVSWLSNLLGCLLMLGLFHGARVWPHRDDYLIHLAESKCSQPWGVIVVRGIIANVLVCYAVWLANASRDAAGKIMGIYMPIMSFTAIGLEHSIASMYIVPMGIIQGADVTVGRFIAVNLIPATIGNWIGGACVVGLLSSAIHGGKANKLWASWDRMMARCGERLQRGQGMP